ncbi:MAG: PAS domain S-box protein [Gemmatimonadaceae bacterium]|nr:PAS domain S-box protein [Gemmatimonadaceae bacterium]
MSDVSCRVFTYFHAAEKAGWIDIDTLLDGFPLSRAYLENPSNRVAWNLWRQLCERSARQLGSTERIRDSGGFAVNPTIAGFFGPAMTLFSSPKDIYRIAFRWLCPSIYRSHRFIYGELPDGRIELRIELREGHEGCLSFMLMFEGGIRAAPRFVKLPDAIVQTTSMTDRRSVFVVTPPANRSLTSRISRLLRASTTSSEIEAELTFQQQQLLATHESLRTSERSFRSVLDALPVLIAIQRNGRIVYANPALARSLGVSSGELIGQSLDALVVDDDRARFRAMVLDDPRDLGRLEELRMRFNGGVELHAAALGVRDVMFEGEAANGLLALDLTERQQIEAKLRDSEDTMAALVATLPDLIVRISAQGVLLDSQGGTIMRRAGTLQHVRGRQVRELIGRLPGVTEELVTRGLETVRESIADREVRQLETEVTYDDGSHRTFELRFVPIAARSEVLVIVRDVTRRRAEERQLAISDRLISLGTLAAGVAHEINNPLTYVMGSLSDLTHSLERLRGGASAVDIASLQPALDQAREGVARVAAIVRSLGAISRVDARHIEPMDVHEVLEQAIAITAHELRRSARLVRGYSAAHTVMADRVQLVQVMVNLLANAAQAIPEGNCDANEIRVTTGEAGSAIWIEVQDTGVGIAPGDVERVFDPFFTTKLQGHGTGLGLAISHRIVGDLGGRLTVRSAMQRGSTFRVELPRATVPARDDDRRGADPLVAPSSARILIVDDEPVLAEMARRALAGWDADVVHSGRAALAMLAANAAYDLVLCDITMPELTGVDVYEQSIQRQPDLAERFLFMCGGVTTDRAQRFLDDVKPQVLWKPFDTAQLRSWVGNMLAGSVVS